MRLDERKPTGENSLPKKKINPDSQGGTDQTWGWLTKKSWQKLTGQLYRDRRKGGGIPSLDTS